MRQDRRERSAPDSDHQSSGGMQKVFQGLRVLVVEDELLLGLSLHDDLQALGCIALGPLGTLAQAFDETQRSEFDLAILDVNLHGQMVYPLADELSRRGIPYLFLTGYAMETLPETFRGVPHLAKPYDAALLAKKITVLLRSP